MSGIKITELPASTTPLSGSEIVPLVQGGVTKRATVTQIGTVTATGTTAARTLPDRFAETVSVKDFGAVGDGVADDTAAIQAAVDAVPAAGGVILFPPGTYKITSAIIVNKSRVALISEGRRQATINSTSTTANHFTVNAAGAAYIYDIVFEGFAFTRSSTCSAGASINLTNVGYFAIRDCRFYGDSKSWQHVKVRSCVQSYFEDNLFEWPQREQIDIGGGSASPGTTDGWTSDIFVNHNQFIGGHAATPDPNQQGAVTVGDYCGGIFFNDNECFSHKGYHIRLGGSAAGRAAGANTLVFIKNPNVEATYTSGFLYVDHFWNVVVTHGWVSGKNTPTVNHTANAAGLQLTALQIAIDYSDTLAPAVQTNGTQVQVVGCDIVGYNAGVGPGISLGANADEIIVTGNRIRQCQYGVFASSAASKKITITGNILSANILDPLSGFAATDPTVLSGNVGLPYSQTVSKFYAGGSSGNAAAEFFPTTNAVNRWYFAGTTTGNGVYAASAGSDTNIGMVFEAKGTGNVQLQNSSNGALITGAGGGVSSGETAMFLTYHNGTTTVHQRVTVGAANSGGTGYKLLRVANT